MQPTQPFVNETNITYQSVEADLPKLQRRRKLLPWWVIGFIWIFLVFALLMPVGIILGLLNYDFEISLLGLTTHDPISLLGGFLMLLFAFKGVTAFALWTEKTWAIGLAKIDAITSIVICVLVMVAPLIFAGRMFTIRLELIALFPYYIKMNKIEYDWVNFGYPDVPLAEASEAI